MAYKRCEGEAIYRYSELGKVSRWVCNEHLLMFIDMAEILSSAIEFSRLNKSELKRKPRCECKILIAIKGL